MRQPAGPIEIRGVFKPTNPLGSLTAQLGVGPVRAIEARLRASRQRQPSGCLRRTGTHLVCWRASNVSLSRFSHASCIGEPTNALVLLGVLWASPSPDHLALALPPLTTVRWVSYVYIWNFDESGKYLDPEDVQSRERERARARARESKSERERERERERELCIRKQCLHRWSNWIIMHTECRRESPVQCSRRCARAWSTSHVSSCWERSARCGKSS